MFEKYTGKYREDREVRTVIVQIGGKHPLGSRELMYLLWKF